MIKYLILLLLTQACFAQQATFSFAWNTNGLKAVKEYKIYVNDRLICTTTNNFVTVSNLMHGRYVFYATAVGVNGKESLPSRKVAFPRDLPEAPKCFEYSVKLLNDNMIEKPISPTTVN